MSGRADLRIGTAERDQAATALGEHYSAGRLSTEEFDERVRLAYQARTRADLEPLFADLPSTQRETPRRHRPGFDRRLPLIVLVVAACIAWVAIVRVPPFFVFPLMWIFFGTRRRFWTGGQRT
jgi:hypothetical protein